MPQVRYIFLSHHSVDKPIVEPLVTKLEQHKLAKENNIKVWLDKTDLKHGEQYTHQFAEAIEASGCCAFVVFMPSESVRAYVEYEIGVAFDRQMNDKNQGKQFPILPVYPGASQERIPLPSVIKTYNYRENISTDDSQITDILNDVINAISENEKVITPPKCGGTGGSRPLVEKNPSNNHTLELALDDQWLCFDVTRENGNVTATSVDDNTKYTQLPERAVFDQFPSNDLASKLFPSAFPENGSPKRLRIRTDDNDLAMLPWAQLHPETVVEVSSITTHYRPDFNKLNITTPLVVIPEEPQKLKPNTHYRLLHEYFNGYLNIRGPIPRVTNRISLKR